MNHESVPVSGNICCRIRDFDVFLPWLQEMKWFPIHWHEMERLTNGQDDLDGARA